ncbi:MAG: hypothetical protein ABR570_03690 [Burkholderiales bacterium]
MKRFAIPLTVLAAATLVACSSTRSPAPTTISAAAPIAPQQITYRPGTGVIQNVTPAPAMGSAIAGGSATTNRPQPPVGTEGNRAASGGMNRLAIKMDAGGQVQYVDTDASEFQRGMRVELTPDHMIRRL